MLICTSIGTENMELANTHKACDPEMSIHQETDTTSVLAEPLDHAWHQIPYYDEVADPYSETLDCNCGVEYYGGVRVCNL